jgi:hypothetical protein
MTQYTVEETLIDACACVKHLPKAKASVKKATPLSVFTESVNSVFTESVNSFRSIHCDHIKHMARTFTTGFVTIVLLLSLGP